MGRRVLAVGICLSVLLAARAVRAGVPHYVSVQGVLTGVSEQPIDGTRNVTFRIYDVSSGGTVLWTETQSVNIDQGRYGVFLGSVAPLDLPFDKDCWLSVEVESDGEMTPRYRIGSSPYAYNSETVNAILASAAPQADALLALDASGKFPNSVLSTGPGNGLDADTVDGKHAADLADATHTHDAADIGTGVIDSARLNIGTGANQLVALDGSGKLPAVDGSQVTNVQAVGVVPVGAVVAWMKSMFGTPALPAKFVECNGQVLNDPESPYDGQTIPLLNGASEGTKRFLRGSGTSGTTGGSVQHSHGGTTLPTPGGSSVSCCMDNPASAGTTTKSTHVHSFTTDTEGHLPPHYEVVWIMRTR